MRTGSLFTGYCGLDRAAHAVFGGELAWVSDNHPSAVKLLAHRLPQVPNLGDITAIDWNQVEPVDLITAGFPCQDISPAGKRAGIEGARSGLWSHVVDAVRVLRPRHVVLENVSALLVRGLDRVVADLAAIGYDLRWTCVRAADVGAPHRRDRWFGYATAQDTDRTAGGERRLAAPGQAQGGRAWADAGGRGGAPAASPEGHGRNERGSEPAGLLGGSDVAIGGGEAAADANRGGLREQPVAECGSGGKTVAVESGSQLDWGQFGPAIHRWEHVLGRPAPEPTQAGRGDSRVLSPRFVKWMQGVEPGWVTDVPGLSRSDMLRLLGNGVVSQQGEAALRWLAAQELRGAA